MTEKTVDYFYTLGSPWTYLGHAPFIAMAHKAGVRVVHKPCDIGAVFAVSGGLPLPKRSIQRQHYRLYELQRWRAHRGVPLNLQPKFFPVDGTPAGRMVVAAQMQGLDTDRLAGAFLKAVWAEDRNIADQATMKTIADECGMDGAALLQAAQSAEAGAAFEANTEEAKRREVFGAPFFIYRDEPFWGQDRLDFLERAMTGAVEPVTLPA